MPTFPGNPATAFAGSGVVAAAAITADALPAITAVDPNTGDTAGGENVTVWGTGFLSGDQVTIDGNATTEAFVDTGKITFVTPADTAGAVNVLVVRGADNSNAKTFTYVSGGGLPADMEFAIDWSTGTGTSENVLKDSDKTNPWTIMLNSGNLLEVVNNSSEGKDFPTTNILKVTADNNGSGNVRAAQPQFRTVDAYLTVPAIDASLFWRYYLRIEVPDSYTADPQTHGTQDGDTDSDRNWKNQITTNTDGTYELRMDVSNTGVNNPFPNGWWRVILNKNQTYRIEHQINRIGDTTFNLHARIYDVNDNLLFDDSDFSNQNGSANLSSTPTLNFGDPGVSALAALRTGINGLGDQAGAFPFTFAYLAGWAIRRDDWNSAYQSAESSF